MSSVYHIAPRKQTNVHNETLRRVNKKNPCPVCSHTDWCEVRSDGAVHCMRVESDRPGTRMGGWWHNEHAEPSDLHSQPAITHKPAAPLSPPEVCNAVYSDLLSACGLGAQHDAYLLSCGIDGTLQASYASLNGNRSKVAAYLLGKYPADVLAGIPGLWIDETGHLRIAAADGMLVAVRNVQGRIVRMQCRVELNGSKSYPWLSSSKYGGPSSGAIAHVARGATSREVWITEGVKKADVTAHKTGCTTIGLPGHASQASGLALLDELIAAGTRIVTIALDEDPDEHTAQLVGASRQKLTDACLARGLVVLIARWQDSGYKGIDDLLLAGGRETLTAIGHGESKTDAAKVQIADDLVAIISSKLPDLERLAVAGARIALGDKPHELTPARMPDLALCAGMHGSSGKQKVGRALADAASRGVVTRVMERDTLGHSHLSIAVNVAALPSTTEIIAPAPRSAAHNSRSKASRTCSQCGSTNLYCHCQDCGNVEPLEPGSTGFSQNPVEPGSTGIRENLSVPDSIPVDAASTYNKGGVEQGVGVNPVEPGSTGSTHKVYWIPPYKPDPLPSPCPGCGRRYTARPMPDASGVWCGRCGMDLA